MRGHHRVRQEESQPESSTSCHALLEDPLGHVVGDPRPAVRDSQNDLVRVRFDHDLDRCLLLRVAIGVGEQVGDRLLGESLVTQRARTAPYAEPHRAVGSPGPQPLDGGVHRPPWVERLVDRFDHARVGPGVHLEALEDRDGGLDRFQGAHTVRRRPLGGVRLALRKLDARARHGEGIAELVRHEARESAQPAALVLLAAHVAQQEHRAPARDGSALHVDEQVASGRGQADEHPPTKRLGLRGHLRVIGLRQGSALLVTRVGGVAPFSELALDEGTSEEPQRRAIGVRATTLPVVDDERLGHDFGDLRQPGPILPGTARSRIRLATHDVRVLALLLQIAPDRRCRVPGVEQGHPLALDPQGEEDHKG